MRSFSLIEVIIAIALFTLLVAGILEALNLGVKTLGRSKFEGGAAALAIQRMEFTKNLPYDQIGTQGGIPSGSIPQQETRVLGGVTYTIRTLIQYVDDGADGIGSQDSNSITADYKRARVQVSWPSKAPITPVVLISTFAPPQIETLAGGGMLRITVLNALGSAVSLASVNIKNTQVNPPIDVTTLTSDQGEVLYPGSPAASSYEVTATKTGYSTAQTYGVTAQNVNPNPGHLTVLAKQTTQAGFAIDKLSTLTLNATSTTKSVANVSFRVRGAKTIGTDANSNPVYKYDQTHQTNSQGSIALSGIEWDNYTITVQTPNYTISQTQPAQPIALNPDSTMNVLIFLQ